MWNVWDNIICFTLRWFRNTRERLFLDWVGFYREDQRGPVSIANIYTCIYIQSPQIYTYIFIHTQWTEEMKCFCAYQISFTGPVYHSLIAIKKSSCFAVALGLLYSIPKQPWDKKTAHKNLYCIPFFLKNDNAAFQQKKTISLHKLHKVYVFL